MATLAISITRNAKWQYASAKRAISVLYMLFLFVSNVTSFSMTSPAFSPKLKDDEGVDGTRTCSRGSFLKGAVLSVFLGRLVSTQPGLAETTENNGAKFRNLPDDELKRLITTDVVDKQFLATAELTRELYDEAATFTDEIDTYTLPQWIKGTKKLFVGDRSRVNLVGDVTVSSEKVEFRFDEDLMFRIPLRPVVSLTGRVVLERDPETGLITSYKEYWDQNVVSVLKTAQFN